MDDRPSVLYHFTCTDGYRQIGRYNCVLRPQPRTWPVVWLTTQAKPDFDSIGLGDPVMLTCDRREHRYIVTDLTGCRPWLGSPERAATSRALLEDMEMPGVAAPQDWWISAGPVHATWDRSWALERSRG